MINLSDIIPNKNNKSYSISDQYLLYKKYTNNIPIAFIENNIPYIILDIKLEKQIIKIINHLSNTIKEFYFTTPEITNPSGVYHIEHKIILNYFMFYINNYKSLKKINFDFIENLAKWINKNKIEISVLKEVYSNVLKKVNNYFQDFYSNKKEFDYDLEIRNEIKTLYRDIIINIIISK